MLNWNSVTFSYRQIIYKVLIAFLSIDRIRKFNFKVSLHVLDKYYIFDILSYIRSLTPTEYVINYKILAVSITWYTFIIHKKLGANLVSLLIKFYILMFYFRLEWLKIF